MFMFFICFGRKLQSFSETSSGAFHIPGMKLRGGAESICIKAILETKLNRKKKETKKKKKRKKKLNRSKTTCPVLRPQYVKV